MPPNDTANLEDSEGSSSHCQQRHDLGKQLEHDLAALFSLLHIRKSSVQEVIQQLLLSQPLLHNSVRDILKQHIVREMSRTL